MAGEDTGWDASSSQIILNGQFEMPISQPTHHWAVEGNQSRAPGGNPQDTGRTYKVHTPCRCGVTVTPTAPLCCPTVCPTACPTVSLCCPTACPTAPLCCPIACPSSLIRDGSNNNKYNEVSDIFQWEVLRPHAISEVWCSDLF